MRTVVIMLLLTLLSSCENFHYRKRNRLYHKVKPAYSKDQDIIVKNAIICGNLGGFLNQTVDFNRDSVLKVFVSSLQKLPVVIDYRQDKVFCIGDFIAHRRVKYRKFNFSELETLIGNEMNTVLIPVINLNYVYWRNQYITSTGAVGGEGLKKNVLVDFAALIFRNRELVYFKSRVFSSPAVLVRNYRESIDFSIKQENIDTLVQLTMKDYLERMK